MNKDDMNAGNTKIFEGDIHQALSDLMNKSKACPNHWMFVILESEGTPPQPTGNIQILTLQTEQDVKKIMEGRPPNGLFVVFKNGEQIDDSDRFFTQKYKN